MIETKDLTFTYPAPEGETNPPALRGVSVTVEKGTFVVVLGHNGSGKSTLAKHMNGILVPNEGRVLVKDIDSADESQGIHHVPLLTFCLTDHVWSIYTFSF